jgi:TolA-binding protein
MEAALKLDIDNVAELKQQVAHLERIREQHVVVLKDLEKRISAMVGDVSEMRRISMDRQYRERLWGNVVQDLARARSLIRNGQSEDGLYELERALDHVDSGWRVYA